MSGRVASLFRPWAGLIIGVLAAAFAHQFGADGSFNDCQRFVPVPILFIAALCVAACLIGAGLRCLSSGEPTNKLRNAWLARFPSGLRFSQRWQSCCRWSAP